MPATTAWTHEVEHQKYAYMDVGTRATQDTYMDAGGRALPGASAEQLPRVIRQSKLQTHIIQNVWINLASVASKAYVGTRKRLRLTGCIRATR
jgi:hypothetical protein